MEKKIPETKDITITKNTIPELDKISAVVYGTGASGLEGLLAGIPTFRIRSHEKVDINVLKARAKAIQDKENFKNTIIIISFLLIIGAIGIYFSV